VPDSGFVQDHVHSSGTELTQPNINFKLIRRPRTNRKTQLTHPRFVRPRGVRSHRIRCLTSPLTRNEPGTLRKTGIAFLK